MKKLLLYLFPLVLLFCAVSCSSPPKAHFVALQDGHFVLNNKPFYPVTLNYMVSLQSDGKELWPCAYTGYNMGNRNRYTSKDSCLMELQADMDLIRQMGFNTVRLVGIGEEMVNKKNGSMSLGGSVNNQYRQFPLASDADYGNYFNALQELFNVVNKADLKLIFLTRMSADSNSVTEKHLERLVTKFRADSVIMAYDLFNEPLYFDSLERSKEQVYAAVKRWNAIIKNNAPDQLSTIGLEGIREVFEWDPNILDLDFLTFHPYEYEPEQVRNEIYWYGKYVKKPWMLGETAIPADNDSVSYDSQRLFAEKTIKQTYDCGGIGYAWWQYKDVDWNSFHANYMGVVALRGQTKNRRNELVYGTVKPVASAMAAFNSNAKKDTCKCMANYYNYSGHRSCRITGYLKDKNGNPIEGGVILAWNEFWSHSYHTVSRADGSFELLGNFPFYHWMASATQYTMVRGELKPDTATMHGDNIPTISLGEVKIETLPFLR